MDTGKLRELCDAATPGPWTGTWEDLPGSDARVCYTRDGKRCEWCIALSGETLDGVNWTPETLARWKADARFIAEARNAMPELLDRLEKLEESLEQFRAWADGYKTPKQGMGAGLHAEMWPSLTPSAQDRMLEIVGRDLDGGE